MIIMAKKKKHVHTEKERLFQEEAARKRAEKAAAAKRRRKKETWGVLLIAGVLIALALGFSHADGAIGYSVSGGLAVLAGFIDGAVRLSARKRFKRT